MQGLLQHMLKAAPYLPSLEDIFSLPYLFFIDAFENAYLVKIRSENGRRDVGTRLSEEEVVHLAAWLAPEVVLCSQLPNTLNSACAKGCVITPAVDIFGVGRVMQEIFEPHCAPRFSCSSEAEGSAPKEIIKKRTIVTQLRPAIKKAIRREPHERGSIEDLHVAVVQTFWVSLKQNQKIILRKYFHYFSFSAIRYP